jgi:ferredoxin-type protein NapH
MTGDIEQHAARRGFFREVGRWAREEAMAFAEPLVDEFLERTEPAMAAMAGPQVLRPPGAIEEQLYRQTCLSCGKCIEACPQDSIVFAGDEVFPDVAGQPVIIPRTRPCYHCDVFHCQEACPSGALQPLAWREMNLGTAKVLTSLCIAHHGQTCEICHSVCPLKDEAIELRGGLPVVIPAVCTGCGLCEHACPTHPAAIRVFSDR